MIYRHGDLTLISISKLPKGLRPFSEGKENVLALGEITGHKHTLLTDTDIEVFEDDKGIKYFNLPNEAKITHQEHGVKTLVPEIYKVLPKIEFDYFEREIRVVRD